MKRSLSFRCRTACLETHQFIDVLIVFFARAAFDMSAVDDALQDALKTNDPLPDSVALISFGTHTSNLIKVWTGSKLQAEGLKLRGRTTTVDYLKELSIWTFENGKFVKKHRDAHSRSDFKLDMAELVQLGLADRVDRHNAFQQAPAGHVFRHPSKRQSTHFLMASELLKDETDAYFVGLAVCAAAWPRICRTKTVHIDTMGIYSVARAIEDIANASGCESGGAWEIDSFHSHGGVNGLYSILQEHELILISASTTGSMARQLVQAQVPEDAIVTLLEMSQFDRCGTIVYARDRYSKPQASSALSTQGTAVIELAGEYFAARGKKPRSVVLTKGHKREELDTLLSHFSDAKACALNRKRAGGLETIDLVSLDEASVANNQTFKTWLFDEIRLKTPMSVTHVIYVGGAAAEAVACLAAAHIADCSGKVAPVVNADDLSSLNATSTTGVLVCAPIVGNGHTLRSLARDLRELVPDASRHFVVGISLPSTSEAWQRLILFLTQSGDKDRPYQLSRWSVLPMGSDPGRGAAWGRADIVMQRVELLGHVAGSPWSKEVVEASTTLAATALENSTAGFLPTPTEGVLKLTEGFVYWTPKEGELDACDAAATSFVSMSTALQHAREFPNPALRLASSLHETVVLDPENFLRFNDGVLQASLLRAAQPHELDYSGAAELSEMTREFLEKVFLNHTRNYGEAALEFAFALASGHLRLARKDERILIEKAAAALSQSGPLVGLLYYWWFQMEPREQMQSLIAQAASVPEAVEAPKATEVATAVAPT